MIGWKIKELFFDRQAVLGRVDAATRKVLSRFGAFVRQAARSSIRTRKKSSEPGQPPSSHTGLLKKFIFFGYEPDRRSVVIGPVRLSEKGRGEAPSILEYGGTAHLRQGSGGQATKSKRVRIQPRPFMTPAFEKEQPKLPAMWHDSIK